MKKITPVLLAAAMVLPLAACSAQQQSGNNSGQPETTAAQAETKSAQTENDRERRFPEDGAFKGRQRRDQEG